METGLFDKRGRKRHDGGERRKQKQKVVTSDWTSWSHDSSQVFSLINRMLGVILEVNYIGKMTTHESL